MYRTLYKQNQWFSACLFLLEISSIALHSFLFGYFVPVTRDHLTINGVVGRSVQNGIWCWVGIIVDHRCHYAIISCRRHFFGHPPDMVSSLLNFKMVPNHHPNTTPKFRLRDMSYPPSPNLRCSMSYPINFVLAIQPTNKSFHSIQKLDRIIFNWCDDIDSISSNCVPFVKTFPCIHAL